MNNYIGYLNQNQFAAQEDQIVFTEQQLAAQKLDRIRDAAPELLAALEVGIRVFKERGENHGALQQMEQAVAIAKAKGF